MLSYQLQTAPILEPLTVPQAKLQLRLDDTFTQDDTLIAGLITAAREVVEKYTRRPIFNQTWVLSLDAFPWWNFGSGTVNPAQRRGWPLYFSYWDPLAIRLPKPRCLRVISITYLDLTGTLQTLNPASYYVDTISEPARIVPMPSLTWPSTQLYLPGSVQVTFEAASFVTAVTETFTVPSTTPYIYTLVKAPQTAVEDVMTTGSTPTAVTGWTNAAGVLTLPGANAGQQLAVSYYTPNCPLSLQSAMLLLLAHLYENRLPVNAQTMSEMPWSISALLDLHRFEQFTYENGN